MSFTISYDIIAIDKFSRVAAQVKESMDKLDGSVRQVQKSNEKAIGSFKKLGTSAKASSIKMNSALDKTNTKLKQQKKILDKVGKNLKTLGGGTSRAGRSITTGLTVPIVGLGAASVKMSMDFNKSMANVGSLIPGQTKKLYELKRGVSTLGVETGTSLTTMGDGLYQVISAIGDTADVMDVLRISSVAATAGVSETKDSVNLLTKVSTAYGDTSAQMIQRVSDMSFLAVKLGVTTFPELAASMGNIASTAQGMGVSMTELFADTAALTKVLGGTAQAATAMDAAMSGLMVGGGDLDKVFKKLHVKSGNELIERFGGLTGALQAMKMEVGGSEVALKKLFGRKEAQKAAGLLTGSLAGIATDNLIAMSDAAGETKKAFDEQTKGINKAGFAMKQAGVQATAIGVKFGDRLGPILIRILDKLDPFITKFLSLSDASLELAIKIAGIVAAAGPLLLIVGALITGVGKLVALVGAAGGLSGALAILTGPVGLAIAGFAALGAMVALCWDELKPVRDMLKTEFSAVLDSVSGKTDGLASNFEDMAAAIRSVVEILAPAWAWFGKLFIKLALLPTKITISQFKRLSKVISKIERILKAISKIAVKVKDRFVEMGESFARWFNKKTEGIWFFDAIRSALRNINRFLDKTIGRLAKLKDSFLDLPNKITGFVAENLEDAAADDNTPRKSIRKTVDTDIFTAWRNEVKVDVQLHAPEGTIGEVKKKSSGKGANVNVGKNRRGK